MAGAHFFSYTETGVKMKKKYRLPRGTYDILPSDSNKWKYVRNQFRQTAEHFCYQEITTPIFEQADLFERSVGDTSDIVEKEMYKFTDKKNRLFALRPEGTASVVRAVVEHNLVQQENQLKVFYMGPMFRYDRPQKGRYRQFYQYGIEFLGSENPYFDAEVIAFADQFLKNVGLSNYRLEINSIGCSTCTKDYDKALINYFTPFQNELCSDCIKRLEKIPKRILDCKLPSCKKIAENAPSMLDYLDEPCRIHFNQVKSYLDQLDISYTINPKIVRGLDYYTQTAFEFIDDNLGAQSTLIGGGRYNSLVKEIGGKETSGIGFAGGFERLLLSLEANNIFAKLQNKIDVFIVSLGSEAQQTAIQLLQQLRYNKISAEIALEKTSMRAQMKAADKQNATYAIIIGEDELRAQTVLLRQLQSGEQKSISISSITSELETLLQKC